MKRSEERILTTHVGSLPRSSELYQGLRAREDGGSFDEGTLERMVDQSVSAVARKQSDIGIDIVNDGEHSKSSFSAYTGRRLGGFEPIDEPFGHRGPTRDRIAFPGAYEDHSMMCAARPHIKSRPRARRVLACTGHVTYVGLDAVRTDIENLKAAIGGLPVSEAFITALSPNNVAMYYKNKFYNTEEEYYVALAEAMREEYKAIVDAGFVVQIDDPRLATHYDRHPDITVEDCRKFIEKQVEYINHSLRGIPSDRVRFHTCYSTNVAPRTSDLELRHYVDLMLKVNAEGYSFEAANPRHEHEWQVWETCKLPEDKLLIPGVVSHCVSLVEHPELVAQRISRFAGVVGRERVLASNDCGFATSGAGDEVHPEVAWAKMQSLVEGARLASKRLWGA